MPSNYEKAVDGARRLFLAHDPASLAAKYPVDYDGRSITLRFVDRRYRIDCSDGSVTCPDQPEYTPGHDEIMSLWDMLCFAPSRPSLAHQWVQTGSLSGITSGHDDSYLIVQFRKAIAKRPEGLEDARIALGGMTDRGADFAMVLNVFDWFLCRFCYWEADDEFPDQAVFYWDANARQFVHYETLWFMNMYLSQRIWAAVEKREWKQLRL